MPDLVNNLFDLNIRLMSGSCDLDRASNEEIGVECQIFVIVEIEIQVSSTARPRDTRPRGVWTLEIHGF